MKRISILGGLFFLFLSYSVQTFGQQQFAVLTSSSNLVPTSSIVKVISGRNVPGHDKTASGAMACQMDSLKYTVHNVTSCSGTPCDGGVDITGAWGLGLSGNLTFSWSTGPTTPSVTGLCPSSGTLSVLVSDANGCSILLQPNVLTGKATGHDTLAATMVIGLSHTDGNGHYWICDGDCLQLWVGNKRNLRQVGVVDTSTGGGPYTYQWSASTPGGNNSAGIFGDCPRLGFPPTYSVTITDAACLTTTTSYTADIRALPFIFSTGADVNPTCANLCNGRVSVSGAGGTAPYTYTWNNGVKTAVNSSLCAGAYTVSVLDASQCPAPDYTGTLVAPPPIVTNVTSTNTDCFGLLGTATVNSVTGGTPGAGGYTYSWNTTPAQSTTGITGLNDGEYIVTITDSKACVEKDTVHITGGAPYNLAALSNAAFCAGQSDMLTANPLGGDAPFSYSWNPGGTTGPNLTVTSAASDPASATLYTVTATDANGCIASESATLTVNPLPVVTLTPPDKTVCKGDIVQLNAGGGNTYGWSPSAELDMANIANPRATVMTTNTYTVTVTSAANCSATSAVTLSAAQPPNPDAGQDVEICENLSTPLHATGGTSYSWLPVSGLDNPNIADPSASPAFTTTYTVTVTTDPACPSATDMVTVGIHNVPVISGGPDTSVLAGALVELYVSGGGPAYTWYPPDGLSCTACPNPVAQPTETTTYVVSMTDGYGCRASDVVIINVDDTFTLYAPNAFTPSKLDGNNDIFYAYGVGIFEFEFSVFNRWGKKIFESRDPGYGWNGTYQGQLVEQDVYVWIAKAKSFTGKSISKTGSVTVLK